MADPEFTLSVSNAALSGLLYDCCNNESDQVGLLIGKFSRSENTVITDMQRALTKVSILSDVFATLPLEVFSFYNAGGLVDFDQLDDLMGELSDQVIGWYTFRRNSTASLSLRECLVDRQLRSAFKAMNGRYFVTCVVAEHKDQDESTLDVQYTFYTRHGNKFNSVKVEVDNLAESIMNFKKEFIDENQINVFSQINGEDPYKTGMPGFISSVQNDISSQFHKLIALLTESDKRIAELKKKVQTLKKDSSPGSNFKNSNSGTSFLTQKCRSEPVAHNSR